MPNWRLEFAYQIARFGQTCLAGRVFAVIDLSSAATA